MNENLIFEGNTIYEIDPVCMREKQARSYRVPKGNSGRYASCQAAKTCGGNCFTDTWMIWVFLLLMK